MVQNCDGPFVRLFIATCLICLNSACFARVVGKPNPRNLVADARSEPHLTGRRFAARASI